MAIHDFPPVETADQHGLLALGGDLEVDSLLLAYSRGIFPWPISKEYPLAWFSPNPRGILFFKNIHLSKSFKKFLKNNPYTVKFNTDFENVIRNCSTVKRQGHEQGDNETWITEALIHSYKKLYEAGHAYSVETYLDDKLVGGVYGVCINRFYSGESMFYKADNASKVALIALMYSLNQKNIYWLDTQMVTPVVKSLGGIEIPRKTYLEMLKVAIEN